jgi:hypothetical protein
MEKNPQRTKIAEATGGGTFIEGVLNARSG